MSRRRVAVTGLGIIAPVGIGVAECWTNVLAARSGIGRITRFDASGFPSQIAGEVKGFDVAKYLSGKEARRYDTFIHYGLVATMEAVRDAGLEDYGGDKERVGVCIGSGIGGLPMIEETHNDFLAAGPRKISPFFIPGTIINMISGNLSIMFGLKGPNISVVTACTTGLHAVGLSARMIEHGDADVMVAGTARDQRACWQAHPGVVGPGVGGLGDYHRAAGCFVIQDGAQVKGGWRQRQAGLGGGHSAGQRGAIRVDFIDGGEADQNAVGQVAKGSGIHPIRVVGPAGGEGEGAAGDERVGRG